MLNALNAEPATAPEAVQHQATMLRPGHIPALDGLRGIAIILVLVCHFYGQAGVSKLLSKTLAYGWVGVDLFLFFRAF